MPEARRDNAGALLRVAIAGTVWGSIPLVVRFVHAHPLVIVFWRVALSALAMVLYLAVTRRLSELSHVSRRKWLALGGLGLLLAVNWALFLSGYKLAAGHVAAVALLAYCGPVFVAALNHLVTGEPFDRRVLLPLALALGGTAIIVNPADLTLSAGPVLIGEAMAFGSALTYAGLMLSAKRVLRGTPTPVVMVGENGAATLLLLPALFLLPGPQGAADFAALTVLGIGQTALPALLFLSALREVRADHVAILTYAEPLSAVVLAAIFLHEPLRPAVIVGGLMIVAAGVVVARLTPSAALEAPYGEGQEEET